MLDQQPHQPLGVENELISAGLLVSRGEGKQQKLWINTVEMLTEVRSGMEEHSCPCPALSGSYAWGPLAKPSRRWQR